MNILYIRSDNPEAEIGLYSDLNVMEDYKWTAHRELAETLLKKIEELLGKNKLGFKDIGGIVVYKGPGSFTGLRIGFTVANTLSESLELKIVSAGGDNWITDGINRLLKGENEHIALPDYGAEANITKPRS